ncbi:hypothetical protein [Oscillatoria acuminata]|nr:hypothetical protein [Oscillatoria acuminata]
MGFTRAPQMQGQGNGSPDENSGFYAGSEDGNKGSTPGDRISFIISPQSF